VVAQTTTSGNGAQQQKEKTPPTEDLTMKKQAVQNPRHFN
jgi:hypothetical protein